MSPAQQKTAVLMLRGAASQFRFYERNHRAKAEGFMRMAAGEKMAADTIAKAEVNAAKALEIETFLGEVSC